MRFKLGGCYERACEQEVIRMQFLAGLAGYAVKFVIYAAFIVLGCVLGGKWAKRSKKS